MTLDAFEVKAGPEINLLQVFEVAPVLLVDLAFYRAVHTSQVVGYEQIKFEVYYIPFQPCQTISIGDFSRPIIQEQFTDRIVAPWSMLPGFIIGEDTLFSPTFFIDATLRSKIDMLLGWGLDIILGKGSVNLASLTYEFGPLFSEEFNYQPEFGRFSLFDERFNLGGWNSIEGDAFLIKAFAPVPLPAALTLTLAGMVIMAGVAKRKPRKHAA